MKKNNVIIIIVSLAAIVWGGGMANSSDVGIVAETGVSKMQNPRIFFGHQSVGLNILDGIRDTGFLEEHSGFTILNTKEVAEVQGPGIYHYRVGKNREPKSKIDEFAAILREGMATQVDLAALKLCYVDFNSETDVNELFQYYKKVVGDLEQEFPALQIVHFSAPLKTNKISWKTKLKQWLRKDNLWEFAENIKRNEYNNLLLREFQDEDKIFDIATLESTHKNGTRETFKVGDNKYYALAAQYTYDGGHLNPEGRRWIAEHFIQSMENLN